MLKRASGSELSGAYGVPNTESTVRRYTHLGNRQNVLFG